MVRVKKRASKRVSTAQREKVKRKVNEHHRKARKDAKKNQQWKSKTKKDPGIPNSFPYKEQLLEEIQQKREAAQRARLDAKELARQRKANVDSEAGASDDEEVPQELDTAQPSITKKTAPIKSLRPPKEYARDVNSLLNDNGCTGIILALDARDPLAWDSKWMRKSAKESGKNILCALTRSDLVPWETAVAWSQKLEDEFSIPVIPTAASEDPEILGDLVLKMKLWKESALSEGKPTVVVCGFENSGRSSLSRQLESHSWVQEHLTILDSAHLTSADDKIDFESPLRLLTRNKGPLQRVKDPMPLLHEFIRKVADPADLQLIYKLPAFVTSTNTDAQIQNACEGFLTGLARNRGRLRKGDLPDLVGAARTLLRDWSAGDLKYYARPSSLSYQDKSAQNGQQIPEAPSGVFLTRKAWRIKHAQRELRLKPANSMDEETPVIFAHNSSKSRVRFARESGSANHTEDDEVVMEDVVETDGDSVEEDLHVDEDEDEDEDEAEDEDEGDGEHDSQMEEDADEKTQIPLETSKAPSKSLRSDKRRAAPQPGEAYSFTEFF